jgi:hypothetical protein
VSFLNAIGCGPLTTRRDTENQKGRHEMRKPYDYRFWTEQLFCLIEEWAQTKQLFGLIEEWAQTKQLFGLTGDSAFVFHREQYVK